ncbi:MAG TPA: fatty acid cis/trans isomerase, partial [Spongiibacteraceae bacterium]|nr:fatty acid cis/trans isomerase [Spongiibacteraceae bacterium]
MRQRVIGAALVLGLSIVAASVWFSQKARYEPATAQPQPAEIVTPIDVEPPVQFASEYYRDVKPILDRRCLVCHACYDAPCQLKLDSPAGLQRGATQDKIYDSGRLMPAPLTRLFIDAQSTAEWRDKGFFAVLNEGPGSSA